MFNFFMIPRKKRTTPVHHVKVLPNSVHTWRGQYWSWVRKLEATKGDGLRIIRNLKKILEVHARGIAEKRMNSRKLYIQAFEIEKLLSEMTDEVLMAEGKIPRDLPVDANYGDLWNQYYINALRHFWPQFSPELKKEILKQIRHE